MDTKNTIKINIMASCKGGTGKSLFARNLFSWYRDKGYNTLILDCDEDSQTTSRYFPDECISIDSTQYNFSDLIIDQGVRLVEENPTGKNAIVVDMKAGQTKNMLEWFKDIDVDFLKEEYNIELIGFGVLTSQPDATTSLEPWVKYLAERIKFFYVLNEKEGTQFNEFYNNKQFIKSRKLTQQLTIPALDTKYMQEVEKYNIIPCDLITNEQMKGFKVEGNSEINQGIMFKMRLRNFFNKIRTEINLIQGELLPV